MTAITPQQSSAAAYDICALAPVIPVLIVDDLANAAPLAAALIKGGLRVLEVTLRTDAALDVIAAMAKTPDAIVGAGTLLNREQVVAAKNAGATFGVAPGSTPEVMEAALEVGLPMLPGAITPTEVMNLLAQGYDMLKFFPAELAGGHKMLGAFSSPLAAARFCPTGGISKDNAGNYLSLPNVVCVGGSWVADTKLVKAGDWDAITALAADAVKLA